MSGGPTAGRRSTHGRTMTRSRAPAWVWAVAACTLMGVAAADSRTKLVENGYEGVVVGVSQEVDESLGPAIVASITDMFNEASRRLFAATRGRAYFRSVKILIPKSWSFTAVNDTALSENFEDSDVRIDIANSVYKNQPYTQQTGTCGTPGQYIHLTPEYLTDRAQAAWWGPRGKAFLMEWAKFRWGVFDELGYPGDDSFPLFYSNSADGGTVYPTYCADTLVEGRMIDKGGRGACGLNEMGDPDDNCRFLPYRSQTASSSLMSYPFIFSDTIVDFCDEASSDRPHNPHAPTKQNLFCRGKSVWEVMREHPDFADGNNPPTERYVDPEVALVQHVDANYALVLDYSGSMNDHYRILKLQKTARRWLLHEVADGSEVAIIKFSKHAKLVHGLSRIEGAESRKALAESLDVTADGGTSIGAGLYAAVKKILKGKKNPVILLITDGEENENPRIDHIIDHVIASGVRVVTVAFGEEADPKLERVAQVTGGKTFTVNDIDEGHMLEDAFHGALTYQPPPSRQNATVTIDEKVYRGSGDTASETFLVDFTVGRNLVFRLDTDDRAHVTSSPHLIRPTGGIIGGAEFDPSSFVWTINVPMAEQGEWKWQVGVSGNPEKFVRVKITAQTRDPDIHPITTKAWMSSGAHDVNATTDRVIIYAEVKQGNNPVVNARVIALVTPPNESDRGEVYELLDNGQGADIQAGDGIYSRYMTRYTTTGRYSVKAQVTDGGTAVINRGFLTAPAQRTRRDLRETIEERPPYCCGNIIPLDQENAFNTGTFNRISVAGSVKVIEIPEGDTQPPSPVRDFKVSLGCCSDLGDASHNLTLTWTAPGDDLDDGTVSSYVVRVSTSASDLQEDAFNDAPNDTLVNISSAMDGILVRAGEKVTVNVYLDLDLHQSNYFALRAIDDAGLTSMVSNIDILGSELLVAAPAVLVIPVWAIVLIAAILLLLAVASCVVLSSRNTGKYDCVES